MRSKKTYKKRSRTKMNKKGGGKQITIITNSFHRVFLIAYLDDTYCKDVTDANDGLAFEYSSGTSNLGQNFPNTFLPIKHVDKTCYMIKSADLYTYELDGNIDLSLFATCPSSELHLEYFINRFRCWKELQISAALGGGLDARSAWQVFSYFRKLRDFALSNDYDQSTKKFIKRDVKNVIIPFDWKAAKFIPLATEIDPSCDYEEINLWLTSNHVKIDPRFLEDKKKELKLDVDSYSTYRAKIRNADYKLSDLTDPNFKVELPKDISNMRPENIDVGKLKDLNKIVSDINAIKYKEKLDTDLATIKVDSPLYKYIDFVSYSIPQGFYKSNSPVLSEANLSILLIKLQKYYPKYTTDNPFNWEIC